MSREALVLLVCCCDFRDGAERLIPSKSLRNAVIRAFPGLFRILRMCAPRRAAAVVRPRGREKSADRRRRILISRLLIIRASVPRRKSPFPAYFKGFPAVSPLIPPYPAFLKYPVSPQLEQNEMDGPVFKIKDDPRITRVGKFIRKTSLDELPQLWNILKGDMSIVGPRPALPREVEQYGDYEKQRLYVTPGLSCYWQIAPHRNDLSFEEWMDLDVKYVKERSFWVDWKIIFKTFKVCLLGHGE